MASGRHRYRLWWRVYRARMDARLEWCRIHGCGKLGGLTFDHLTPESYGRQLSFDNATILCEHHNKKKANHVWSQLMSLAAEEAAAPPERRWVEIAKAESDAHKEDAFRVNNYSLPRYLCPVCGTAVLVRGPEHRPRFGIHRVPHGVRCTASRALVGVLTGELVEAAG